MSDTTGLIYSGAPTLKEPIVRALKTVFDPEIPVDIYELGLIYKVDVAESGSAKVEMTLTSPACPSAEQLPAEVQHRVAAIDGVTDARVEIVWDPPWTPEMMSEAAKLELGMF
jgi:FeS assembly SUF system protein